MALRCPRAFTFVVGSVSLALLAGLTAGAQQPAPPAPASRLLHLSIVRVKPEMLTAYVDMQKNELVPAMQKAGIKWRDTWRSAIFGDVFEFAHVTEIASLAQFDTPNPMRAAMGEAAFMAYQAKSRTMVTDVNSYALRTRPDLGYVADPNAPPKLAILTRVEVMPDRLMEFETFIKGDWLSALKKGGGKYYAVSSVLYGGSSTEYITLVGIDNFADLAKGHPVTRALGEDGVVKLMAKSGGFAHHIDRKVIRLDPDLSFEVKAGTNSK